MHPGRVAAVVKGMRDNKKWSKKDQQEQDIKMLRLRKPQSYQDPDLYEITKTYMRFRHYPYGFWFLGFGFISGAVLVLTLLYEDFMLFKKLWHEYVLVIGMIFLGVLFLTTGKVKSVIFDRYEREIILRKRTITCHCKTITKYSLDDLTDVRAVWRGINTSQMKTLHYAIILDFDLDSMIEREQAERQAKTKDINITEKSEMNPLSQDTTVEETDEDENAYLTSDAELEMVNFAVNDAEFEEYEKKIEESEKKEAKDKKEEVDEQKSALPPSYSRHLEERKEKSYNWKNWFSSIIPMWNPKIRKGRKYEVKILETKDKLDIRKKIIMIRRFLQLPIENRDIKIFDERSLKKKHDPNDFSQQSIDEHFKKQDLKDKKAKEAKKQK